MTLTTRAVLILTAAGVVAYWTVIFCGGFTIDEAVPGYRNWSMSFPLADFWIAANAIFAAAIHSSNKPLSAISMSATGSALIFLGLYAFAYGVNTGLITTLTGGEIIEIMIKIYCLMAGSWLVLQGYRFASHPK